MTNINWNLSGVSYFPVPSADNLLAKLPPAIYEVSNHHDRGFYLTRKYSAFPLPAEVYNFNNTDVKSDLAELFYNRFQASADNLGVLLIGEKGTGKSLLMKRTANLALANGLPVITVENSYGSESLAKFLSSIKDDAVVLFDEFDKKYDMSEDSENRPSQAGLLSFFDGTSVHRKLIIVTANNRDGINEFFLNRPSRIRYTIDYKGLTYEFVTEYLTKHLKHTEVVSAVQDELDLVPSINFDLLQNVVEEVNMLYPTESIKAIMSISNIKRDDSWQMCYAVTITSEDGTIQLTNDFCQFDWDDLHQYQREVISIGYTAEKLLEEDERFQTYDTSIAIYADKLKQIKGRNHFIATADFRVNKKALPVILEFKRIKVSHTF